MDLRWGGIRLQKKFVHARVSMKISIDISPGEAMDRLSILYVKLQKGPAVWKQRLTSEIEDLTKQLDRIYKESHDFQRHLSQLKEANLLLWTLEDDMSANPEGLGGRIAAQNKTRSMAKKEVDTFFNSEAELKSYKSSLQRP